MDVRLLYFDGCPSWQVTLTHVEEALRLLGRDSVVTLTPVTTVEEAERWSFRGSPTLLLDGVDAFADGAAPVGLSCRMYSTPDGLVGAPTLQQVLAALS